MENSASGQIQQEAISSIKNENTEIPGESRTSSGNENQNERLVIEVETEANSSIRNENTENPEESRTSSGNENQNKRLVFEVKKMLLNTLGFLESDECRIYRVPHHLRKWNEEAYTPYVIAIGPYHHGKKECQTMEMHKLRYLQSFIQRWMINLEVVLAAICEVECRIRHCYVETVQLGRDDFVKMIMLDAIFILELFWRYYFSDLMLVEDWLLNLVFSELLLLENQVPFFVIEEIYYRALGPSLSNVPSLAELTFCFFRSLNIQDKAPTMKIQHFTDLLRFFQLPDGNMLPRRHSRVIFPKYSATQLHEAGVKFEVVSRGCISDLNFKDGVLKIPLIYFEDDTEAHVRNVMSLEQCDPRKPLYVTDFFLILDCLVDTTKDVGLLGDKGIVINGLRENIVVASIVKNLYKGIYRGDMNKDYYDLCESLNEFYEEPWHRWEKRWHRWMGLLRVQYFNSPWRSASTVAAIILLGLTLVQTIFSINEK